MLRSHFLHRAPASAELASAEKSADAPQSGSRARDREALAELAQRLASAPRTSEPDRRAVARSEPRDCRELRHETQMAAIRERLPDLSSTRVEHVIQTQDALFQQNRALRSDFVTGALSEADYLHRLEANQREAFYSLQKGLTQEQFAALFNWKSDSDPYDPDGARQSATDEIASAASLGAGSFKDETRLPE